MKKNLVQQLVSAHEAVAKTAIEALKTLHADADFCSAFAYQHSGNASRLDAADVLERNLWGWRAYVEFRGYNSAEPEIEIVFRRSLHSYRTDWHSFTLPFRVVSSSGALRRWRDGFVSRYQKERLEDAQRVLSSCRSLQRQFDKLPEPIREEAQRLLAAAAQAKKAKREASAA